MDENVHFWKRNARMYLYLLDRNLESISWCAHNPHLPLEGAEVGRGARNYRNFLRSKNNNANCTSSRKERKQQMGCIRFFSRF